MTRRIILVVIFAAVALANFSFSSASSSAKTIVTPKAARKFIIVCLYTGGCRYCGGVQWTPTSTTICAQPACPGVTVNICATWASKLNPGTSKYEVDESTVTFDYSDPAVKKGADEAALKADLIQQVNAQI